MPQSRVMRLVDLHLSARKGAQVLLETGRFQSQRALAYPPVVAGGYVYVASGANVYAVDVATQTQAWANTPGGWLSIAGGQLLVAGKNGTLTAWSLGQ